MRYWARRLRGFLGVGVLLLGPAVCSAEVSGNLFQNPDFSEGVNGNGLPVGWSRYAGGGYDQQITVVDAGQGKDKAVLLQDGDPDAEIGLSQDVPAKGGLTYEAGVEARGLAETSSHGAYIQLRFLPSNKYVQHGLEAASSETFRRVAVAATAPAGTTHARVYLYTHRAPTPKLLLRAARLVSGVEAPRPPYPPPVPPVYTELMDLHINTKLVADGKPNVAIITDAAGAYKQQATRIGEAIEKRAGVKVPVATDESPAGVVPIRGNLIVLGNRSTNRTIGRLYDRYYTLLDLRYPGPEGYVVRTLHDPFGDGHNVVFIGGSDPIGVNAAADVLIEKLGSAEASAGRLTIGRLAEIKLGKGIQVPTDIRKFEIWEASKGYGSTGYFGWNSISKRMAMYYMTGDELHAREFLRLAFPDEKAKHDIAEIDGERIENKDAPLSGPYHYNAHMMILFWDLIEESPVFTDEQRLCVTNAFAKQLDHRKGEGVYTRTSTPANVGSRHGQWSAISLYCLGRYFQKSYPDPIWQQCVKGAKLAFASLHHHAWVSGENDNLFWYNTAIAPVFTYLVLTGDRKPVENGVLATLLRGQEILITGRQPDWALNAASLGFLHKAAYVMQDGRYIHYRNRTGVDTSVLRLGQSFWPEEHIAPKPPDDLVGKWSIQHLPRPMWQARRNGFPLEESFLFGSFRSATDASGDFILIDGFNGASRNPYHTFAILELRIGGCTLLKGYRNQVMTRVDGLVEPHIAMNAALKYRDVVGSTAVVAAEVPDAPYCGWRRTLVQRIGQYALIVDDLVPRVDGDNMEVQIFWETEHAPKTFADGHIEFTAPIEMPRRRTAKGGRIRSSDPMHATRSGRVATMQWIGPVEKGEHRVFFSLVGIQPDVEKPSLDCVRLAGNAAALALPAPALAVAGKAQLVEADLAVLAGDHVFGKGLVRVSSPSAGLPQGGGVGETLIAADSPVDLDWDFSAGRLHLVAAKDTQVRLALAPNEAVRLDGKRLTAKPDENGRIGLDLPAGRHVIEGAKPPAEVLRKTTAELADLLAQARKQCREAIAAADRKTSEQAPPLQTAMVANVGGKVVDLITAPSPDGHLIYAVEGKKVHVLAPDGKTQRTLEADGAIRMIRWWPEHKLLLVGCADEQVIAFDTQGNRKWVFTSVMDPAVFRAAKTYWFKSAPGHEGIHGLYTGVFLDGKSQAFVGSACTLEILDENGKLIKRMVQFWGKVSHFAMVGGPNGSLNLLASRKYNGTNTVAIINNKTLAPSRRGFVSVPSGSTYVPGWSSMNRHHLFYEDLDGDSVKEVVSEINGTWNRVTVWRADGKALYDASFGPGRRIPALNMRDLDVADLNGDGKKEILAATSSGLIVALDHQCRKMWAHRLAGPPTVMKCVAPRPEAPPWIVVGCEDGTVVVLDGEGRRTRSAKVTGRPTCISLLSVPSAAPAALLATDKGEVKALTIE